jgi:hypothetical protein
MNRKIGGVQVQWVIRLIFFFFSEKIFVIEDIDSLIGLNQLGSTKEKKKFYQ